MRFWREQAEGGPVYITSDAFAAGANAHDNSISHGFFSAEGGVSNGLYDSLNCGFGSDDDTMLVAQNRGLCAGALGLAAEQLASVYQVHSADAIKVDTPSPNNSDRFLLMRADGMVTTTPGIGLAILTADCLPLLLADHGIGVIGACHAGWRGAAAGIVSETIDKMRRAGARDIHALIGPAIRQHSYQVDANMRDEVMALDQGAAAEKAQIAATFETDPDAPGKYRFDLPALVQVQLARAGIQQISDCGEDTYAATLPESPRFFSHRRATHASDPDSGRQISIIALTKTTP